MNMAILKFIALILFIYISSASSMSNTSFESMKIGISPFNKAGNDFFNLIRNRIDPNTVKIEDYTDFKLSIEQLNKGANYYLTYYILLVVGVTFVVLMPLVGLFLLCCRCCGKCGGKLKVMDPRRAKCKRIIYGIVLVILALGMLFGTIIALFNNQIVHETVGNRDKSVNVFLGLESKFQNIRRSLVEIKDSTNNSQSLAVDSRKLQGFSNDLDDSIKKFYLRLVKVPEFRHVIEQTKSLKLVLDRGDVDRFQTFLQYVNSNIRNLSSRLDTSKASIEFNLSACSSSQCNMVKEKTRRLKLSLINQTLIDNINKTLDLIKSDSFKNSLAMILNVEENNTVNMKLILDGELKEIKDKISDKGFSVAVKTALGDAIDTVLGFESSIEDRLPSLMENKTAQHRLYKEVKTYESYRYICYFCMSGIIVLIIVCYIVGLLYGTFGERGTDDASCCNRGVGARFLMGGVVLTFLFSSILMIVVISNMMATGVVRTDVCRYTASENQNDAKVLDLYLNVVSKLTRTNFTPPALVDALVNKCSDQNFYSAFSQMNQQMISKTFANYFKNIDEKIVSIVLSQINLTSFLSTNPFESTSSMDLSSLVGFISLLNNDTEFSDYVNELTSVSSTDGNDMTALNNDVGRLRSVFRLLTQYINNSENEFIQWKRVADRFNAGKLGIVTSQSPQLVSAIEKSLFNVLNSLFDEMFKDVKCQNLRRDTIDLFRLVCDDAIDPLNGTWYGIGFVLILMIPALIFACLLMGLYRRVQKFYPDKEEPDYDNYIGFYARADNDAMKKNNDKKVPAHRGYRPIPLQQVTS